MGEIDALNLIAFGPVTDSAVGAEETSAVFDVNLREAVLSQEGGRKHPLQTEQPFHLPHSIYGIAQIGFARRPDGELQIAQQMANCQSARMTEVTIHRSLRPVVSLWRRSVRNTGLFPCALPIENTPSDFLNFFRCSAAI